MESPVSCLNKQDFPDYNPAGDIVARDTQTVTFSCSNASGIQKTGTYLLTLAISDQAGNVTTVDKKLTVYPASVSNLKSEVRFTTDEAVLADGTTPRNLKLTFRDEYENRIYNKAVRIDDTNGK